MSTTRTTRTVRIALTSSVLCLGLVAAGCSDDSSTPETTTVTVTHEESGESASGEPTTTSARSSEPASGVSQGQSVDADKALSVALAHMAGSYAVEVDEEDDRDWEVTLVTKDKKAIEVIIDGVSGEVVSERSTTLNSWEREAPSVTAADAIATALAEKSGRLDSLDFDRENGKVVWEAKIETGSGEWELWIDPTTGEIIKAEHDD